MLEALGDTLRPDGGIVELEARLQTARTATYPKLAYVVERCVMAGHLPLGFSRAVMRVPANIAILLTHAADFY